VVSLKHRQLYPRRESLYPLKIKLEGPQIRSGNSNIKNNLVSLSGFKLLIVQSVVLSLKRLH
jgi:hypothetical protein